MTEEVSCRQRPLSLVNGTDIMQTYAFYLS